MDSALKERPPRAQAPSVSRRVASRDRSVQRDVDHIDQHVQHFLLKHPEVSRRHTVLRKRRSVYEIDGHEVWIEWQHFASPSHGCLMVIDGPLRQPFTDYMTMTETNA